MLNASHQVGPQGIARLQDVGGLGRFVRPAGLDREAAKRAFGEFMTDRPLTADQPEDFDPNGVEGVFPRADVDRLVRVLRDIEARVAA